MAKTVTTSKHSLILGAALMCTAVACGALVGDARAESSPDDNASGGVICVGDCRAVHSVTVADLVNGVNIAVGRQPVALCPAFADRAGAVDVPQLIQGVHNALMGCPSTGPRFVDNGDGTIIDRTTGLQWEKKDQSGDVHEVNDMYVWAGYCSDRSGFCQPNADAAAACRAATADGAGCEPCPDGATCQIFRGATTTIWDWLNQLNAAEFAGHSDWRVPAVGPNADSSELESIDDPSAPGCGLNAPCVPLAFDTGCTSGCTVTSCSCTQFVPDAWGLSTVYWLSTSDEGDSDDAWFAYFLDRTVGTDIKSDPGYVRAVRGGS